MQLLQTVENINTVDLILLEYFYKKNFQRFG